MHGRSLPIPGYKVTLKQIVNELNLTNNAFIFDYEGFGKSNGTPTEENINADAEVALEYVANRMNVSVSITAAFEALKWKSQYDTEYRLKEPI